MLKVHSFQSKTCIIPFVSTVFFFSDINIEDQQSERYLDLFRKTKSLNKESAISLKTLFERLQTTMPQKNIEHYEVCRTFLLYFHL